MKNGQIMKMGMLWPKSQDYNLDVEMYDCLAVLKKLHCQG